MSLLESLVALVVLGLAGVGFLQLMQDSSRSIRHAHDWVQTVALAEERMERTKLPDRVAGAVGAEYPRGGSAARVEVRPWPGSSRMRLVTVTVPLPGGGDMVLHRLAPIRP